MRTGFPCGWVAVFLLTGGAAGFGQSEVARSEDRLRPTRRDDVNTSPSSCAVCHAGPAVAGGSRFTEQFGAAEFVRLNEYRAWVEEDPHSVAFSVLSGPLALQMSQRLGYEVKSAVQCLSCHATETTPKGDTARTFVTENGVSCVACHGVRMSWQHAHFEADFARDDVKGGPRIGWRTYTPARKEEMGLRNLRDPSAKARLCATCHVASKEHGRVLTHEMYAAGHPPLAPFELATLLDGMPRHWAYPTDPSLTFFAKFDGRTAGNEKPLPNWRWELYRFHPADQEVLLARTVAAGAIAALRAEAELLVGPEDVPFARKKRVFAHRLVDLARFDCYTCHHERNPGNAQRRWSEDGSGRPPLRATTRIAVGVVAEHASGLSDRLRELADEYPKRRRALEAAATTRPFGDPSWRWQTAAELVDWCDRMQTAFDRHWDPLYTPEQTIRLRGMLAAAAADRPGLHPEAAMWLGWAYLSLTPGADVSVPNVLRAKLAPAIPPAVRMPPFSETFQESSLPPFARSRLPPPDKNAAKDGKPAPDRTFVLPRLVPAPWMGTVRTFDPDRFSNALKRLTAP